MHLSCKSSGNPDSPQPGPTGPGYAVKTKKKHDSTKISTYITVVNPTNRRVLFMKNFAYSVATGVATVLVLRVIDRQAHKRGWW